MFKNTIIALFLVLSCLSVWASSVDRNFRDMKLPTQKMVEAQDFVNPAAAGTNEVLDANDGNTAATVVTVSTFDGQPDLPRNLVITPGDTTADVAACDIVVNGTNFHGDAISESFTFAENASSATTGDFAFASVTSVVFPDGCEDSPFGATWSIGYGEKIGLKRCMDDTGNFLHSSIDGVYEATRATLAAHETRVHGNTADFNGTMNGSSDFEAFFFQNFRCLP